MVALSTKVKRFLASKKRPDEPQGFSELRDRGREEKSVGLIPAHVFQTAPTRWLENRHYGAVEEFRTLNPALDFALFDDDAIDAYMADRWAQHPVYAVYQQARFPQIKTDIFRYAIVHDRGGYYVDINKRMTMPLQDLHAPDSTGLISFEKNANQIFPPAEVASKLAHPDYFVLQWAFGFTPKHPILLGALDRIAQMAPFFISRRFPRPKTAVLTLTGPGLFTQSVWSYLGPHGDHLLTQAGQDFWGHSDQYLEGSRHQVKKYEHYSRARDTVIVGDDSGPRANNSHGDHRNA